MASSSSATLLPNLTPSSSQKTLFSPRMFPVKSELCSSYIARKPRRITRFGRAAPVSASLGGLLGGIFKGTDKGESTRKRFSDLVGLINGLEPEMMRLSDSELREKTSALRERAQNGESIDLILPADCSLMVEPMDGPRPEEARH